MTGNRLDAPAGAFIDRGKPVRFVFDGAARTGFAGDTVTSALWAEGVKVISRSFKYHRPRATLSAAGHDANSLVQIGDEANVPADTREIEPGMRVEAQNVFGSLASDRARLLDRLGAFLPVGFYYKAFYKPRGAWRRWEPVIRRLAGLGKVNPDAAHGYYDKQYLWADVAVVGGGPAGLAAALEASAARDDIEVVLVEENPKLGGSLTYARFDAEGGRAARERERLLGEIAARPNVRVLAGACCNGWFADHFLPVIQGNRMFKLRAGAVVVATGSYEQPLVFRNNDLPGVMHGSAAQRLINRYGVKPGNRAVIASANADGYAVALDLIAAGVEVACIADLNSERPRHAFADAVADHGVPVSLGATVCEALPGAGLMSIEGARVARIAGEGRVAGQGRHLRLRHRDLVDRLAARGQPDLACGRDDALQRDNRDVRDRRASPRHACRGLGRRLFPDRRRDRGRPPRGIHGGARCGVRRRPRAGGARREGRTRPESPLAYLRTRQGARLRRFRRGSPGPRSGERDQGRLRPCRADEAFLDLRHGAEPGPPLLAQRDPHQREGQRARRQRGRNDNAASALRRGKDRRPGGPQLRARTLHRDASSPCGSGRAHDAGGPVVPPGSLRRKGRGPRRGDPRGSQRRAK